MHRVILRWNDSALLEAARGLGASPLQAWRHHALIPCLRELIGRMAGLVASVWWLRIACLCLLPPEQADPSVSVGSFLSRAADNALLQPMPLVSASLPGPVPILLY